MPTLQSVSKIENPKWVGLLDSRAAIGLNQAMRIRDVTQILEDWFPLSLAESWDNVGLIVGDRTRTVERIMTCLSVTAESAEEAIREKADLIVSHHPILFRKVRSLTSDGPERVVYSLMRAGISVYSPHTAFDGASGGINEQIAERMGLKDVRPLRPASESRSFKLAVFVPESDLDRVQRALFDAGAGRIGEYSECSFRVDGTGSFLGSDVSNPTTGQRGRREVVAEQRLEVVVAASRLRDAIAAMRRTHSYEEPAFDVYPLEPNVLPVGAGRVGALTTERTLEALASQLKQSLSARHVEIVGDQGRMCQRIGIGCGAGGEFLRDALAAGCDVFVTGEARFHDLLAAKADGVGLILAGHYATERFAVETLAERLANRLGGLTVWASREESDPAMTVA